MKLKAFLGQEDVKAKYLNRVSAHAEADEIIKGRYWENGKGCAVGCTIHGNNHAKYVTELGIPEWLARLEDTIFEGLPNGQAKGFPAAFLSAIPVGADLEPVKWHFCAFLMRENIDRVLVLTIDDKLKEQVVASIRGVLALHEEAITTGKWARASAASAAWAAAESAAGAARAAAESAARAARAAAESAAESAARAAWASAAASAAAESAAYVRYRDELLRLLKEAGVGS
jgi:hypothetical protein